MSRWPTKYKQAPATFLIKTPQFLFLCSIQPFSTRHCRGEQRISIVDNNEEAAHVWWRSQNYDETNNTEGWEELEEATNDEKHHSNYKLECCCGCFFFCLFLPPQDYGNAFAANQHHVGEDLLRMHSQQRERAGEMQARCRPREEKVEGKSAFHSSKKGRFQTL